MNQTLYEPNQTAPYTLNRHDVELFLESPRLFYFKHRKGITLPPTKTSALEMSVRKLLRKELNIHRADNTKHPVMKDYGIDAVPFSHTELKQWSEDYVGLQAFHGPTNLIIGGRVDDVWHSVHTEFHVVEFKPDVQPVLAETDDIVPQEYKKELELYQWILSQKGHAVSPTAYFLYIYGRNDKEALDAKLEFQLKLVEYVGDFSWVSDTLDATKECLESSTPPEPTDTNPYYNFYLALKEAEAS